MLPTSTSSTTPDCATDQTLARRSMNVTVTLNHYYVTLFNSNLLVVDISIQGETNKPVIECLNLSSEPNSSFQAFKCLYLFFFLKSSFVEPAMPPLACKSVLVYEKSKSAFKCLTLSPEDGRTEENEQSLAPEAGDMLLMSLSCEFSSWLLKIRIESKN